MPDPRKTQRPGDPPLPHWNVKYSPRKEITVSKEFLGARDGNRNPSEGDTVAIIVDSRGRHRGVVPAGEQGTHTERQFEVVGVEHEGTSRERYHLEVKE